MTRFESVELTWTSVDALADAGYRTVIPSRSFGNVEASVLPSACATSSNFRDATEGFSQDEYSNAHTYYLWPTALIDRGLYSFFALSGHLSFEGALDEFEPDIWQQRC